MTKQKHFSVFFILLLLTISVSFPADWMQPSQDAALPFSYVVLFLYALRTFLCCASAAAAVDADAVRHATLFRLLCFIPPVLYGALVLCAFPFAVLQLYARIVFCTAAAVCAVTLYVRFHRHTEQTPFSVPAAGLSKREQDVAELLLQGKTTAEIAEALFISNTTVKTHIQNMFRKYGVRNRMEFAGKIHAHTEE